MPSNFFRALLALATALFLSLSLRPAEAVVVYPCSLLDLCDRAGVIAIGRCTAVREVTDRRTGLPIRQVTLRLRDVLKAKGTGLTVGSLKRRGVLTFNQYNSLSLKGCDAEPPNYRPGEDVMVFLAPTSKIGFTAPIGMWQGKFDVVATGNPRRPSLLISNARHNSNLSVNGPVLTAGVPPGPRSMQAQRVRRLTLTPWEQNLLTRKEYGPVEYEGFTRLVRKLVANGGIAQ